MGAGNDSKTFTDATYSKLIVELDSALTKTDVCKLKYLCLDKTIGLRYEEFDEISSFIELVSRLEGMKKVSKMNLNLLEELLGNIGEIEMACRVERYLQKKAMPIISRYRRMLVDIASNIDKEQVNELKNLLKSYMPRKHIKRINNSFELFIELEHLDFISENNVNLIGSIGDLLNDMYITIAIIAYGGSRCW
ncbi:caspase-8-like [Antedon mediterranea]|uniref:caspase-8-like n=1 Tax=Antedon mediterranea TaxID=105859 RepID=UPI003AF41B39